MSTHTRRTLAVNGPGRNDMMKLQRSVETAVVTDVRFPSQSQTCSWSAFRTDNRHILSPFFSSVAAATGEVHVYERYCL